MQSRHKNRAKYFQEQEQTTKRFVVPLLQRVINISKKTSVLEIGCGEGGNLKPFVDLGCERIVGIDKTASKIKNAHTFLSTSHIELLCENIYDVKDLGRFDVILVRDVLEHIHGQEQFMGFIKRFIKPDGKVFLGFPPWHNPFGGHQQMCKSKILSKVPFFHILPTPAYQFILEAFGESQGAVEWFLETKATGITIERFENILCKTKYICDKKIFYFINPNYEAKFGLKPRKQWKLLAAMPYIRNFLTTTCYYIVSPTDNSWKNN